MQTKPKKHTNERKIRLDAKTDARYLQIAADVGVPPAVAGRLMVIFASENPIIVKELKHLNEALETAAKKEVSNVR